MKYIFIFMTVILAQAATAQVSIQTLGKMPTDTTKGISGTKWAVMEIQNVMSSSGGMLVEFDNGSRVNLYQIFRADPGIVHSTNTYLMAALEYMDRRGFTLVTTYVANDNTFNRFIFQRK